MAREMLHDVLGGAHGLVLPQACLAVVREDRAPAPRRAASRESRMTGAPIPDGALDLALVAPDGLAVPHERASPSGDVGDAAAHVAGIRVAGDESQGHLPAAAPDEDGQRALDGRRVVAHLVGPVDALRRRSARCPSSMPRMMGSASASQRSRSPGLVAERDAEARVLGLEPGGADAQHGPPAADVVEVVIILATSAGLRNVLAPTMRPIVAALRERRAAADIAV